jgi:sodium/potassium-transporting ATPase subunit alpha
MPVLLNILLGLPQILSSIQMIIICVGVSAQLPFFILSGLRPDPLTDRCPACSLNVSRKAGIRYPHAQAPKHQKRPHGRLEAAPSCLWVHRYSRVLVCHVNVRMSSALELVFFEANVFQRAFVYLQNQGIPFSSLVVKFGDWSALDNEHFYKAQSIYFFTLVIMQWGLVLQFNFRKYAYSYPARNLLASRCRRQSIFTNTPLKNLYCIPAAIMALIIAIFFSYIPWLYVLFLSPLQPSPTCLFSQKIFLTRGIPAQYYFIPMGFGLGILRHVFWLLSFVSN